MNQNNSKNLVIIAGATGGIGNNFFKYYQAREDYQCIGLSRKGGKENGQYSLDLSDTLATDKFIEDLDLKGIERIIYIHSVGIDKFEPNGEPQIDYDNDGIDDEVYSSNVIAFKHIAEPLINKVKIVQKPLTIVNIGSLSDSYNVPYWQSFSKSKNEVRNYCKSIHDPQINNLFMNISSSIGLNGETYARKYADTKYWLTSKEVVEKSVPFIELMTQKDASRYLEADIYKPLPNFTSDYFTNHEQLLQTWMNDMGYTRKEDIPLGIRI